ncbi:MAG: hypothetical protein NVSMB6_15130 [Burkholderiaceae bacterium]
MHIDIGKGKLITVQNHYGMSRTTSGWTAMEQNGVAVHSQSAWADVFYGAMTGQCVIWIAATGVS